MQSPRYAIYWAPEPETALAHFGAGVLGLDGTRLRPGFIPASEWFAITETPMRYGFHGTLKAPFRLAEGQTEETLLAALEAFAAQRAPVAMPTLSIGPMGSFIAFHASGNDGPLSPFAFEIVRHFDQFRAVLSPEEVIRRDPDRLSVAQRENLIFYGYPYVSGEFRFHLTLTDSIADERMRGLITDWLRDTAEAAGVAIPVHLQSLSLFRQLSGGEPFEEIARFPLKGAFS